MEIKLKQLITKRFKLKKMKDIKAYCGQVGDGPLEEILPKLVEEATKTNEEIYLQWNGAFVIIYPNSTVGGLLADYNREMAKEGVYTLYNRGEVIKIEKLVTNIINYFKNLS